MSQLYRQNKEVETAPLDQGLVLLEPKTRRFCALNPTSTLVWARLAEPASLEQLADHIVEHFEGVSKSEALQDVAAIIGEMASLGIVAPVGQTV